MPSIRCAIACMIFMVIGIGVGGYIFNRSQPRSFLSFKQCNSCLKASELYGLIASVGINKFSPFLPFVVLQTDKTVVFRYPITRSNNFHYLLMPKKDIRNIGEIGEEDASYITDIFSTIRYIVEKEGLSKYMVYTNGPGYQDVAYLHFHLVG